MLKILENIIRNALSPPYTSKYPYTPYNHFPGTRADVVFDGQKCILCGLCQRSCPADCIIIHKGEEQVEYLNTQCIRCGYCVRVCPTNAISQNEVYTKPSKEKLTIFTKVTNENAPVIKKRKAAEAAARSASTPEAPGKTPATDKNEKKG
ncbi:MAG TPA: 4Fe-4S binding protein [Methanocella sp.]|nr:4Fe-4S binding protein [Methanocella sp.]